MDKKIINTFWTAEKTIKSTKSNTQNMAILKKKTETDGVSEIKALTLIFQRRYPLNSEWGFLKLQEASYFQLRALLSGKWK